MILFHNDNGTEKWFVEVLYCLLVDLELCNTDSI